MALLWVLLILSLFRLTLSAPYSEVWDTYNLNRNSDASAAVVNFFGEWPNHTYTPSPESWRELPAYTIMPDRWINGDPSNDDYFGTVHEADITQTQNRFGGDTKGLKDFRGLDYLNSMGFRTLYIAGTPFLNMPWQADGYGCLDQSLLDPHYGNIDEWRAFIEEAHSRGFYIVLDMTISTFGDLIGYEEHLETSTPFDINEHDALYKRPPYTPWGVDEYLDLKIDNSINETCQYPRFWEQDGSRVNQSDLGKLQGCRNSEFDQYGDTEAFGVFPDWRRQLSKFASVQDRAREWDPEVMQKLQKYGCMLIQTLDIDGVRIDKAIQMSLDALGIWTNATRACARAVGKNNFFIPGEVTGGNTFASLYFGRGREPDLLPISIPAAINTSYAQPQFFLRPEGQVAIDAGAFHYSIYRSLTRFLGMDGNLQVAYDIDTDFVIAWNQMMLSNDFINENTGQLDPRHMYGVTNQDVFRWPSITDGVEKNRLGFFVTHLLMPGMPLLFFGEEQEFSLFDSQASNYMFGRQPMGSNIAWQMHGCYQLGSEQYYDMPLNASLDGCKNDWNSRDHFDATARGRHLLKHFNWIRAQYPTLRDGFSLYNIGKWTHSRVLPGSSGVPSEQGLWSTVRDYMPHQPGYNDSNPIQLLYTNSDNDTSYTFDCDSTDAIKTPFMAGRILRNLLHPFETHTLSDTPESYYLNGTAPWRGCIPTLRMPRFGYKVLVPIELWQRPPPVITRISPSHDERILSTGEDSDIPLELEFSDVMYCDSVSQSLKLMHTGDNRAFEPSIDLESVSCREIFRPADLEGQVSSAFRWSAILRNAKDGIYRLTLDNPQTIDNSASTGSTDHFLFRKGKANNPVVFPMTARADPNLLLNDDRAVGTLHHSAIGASSFRYSTDFRLTWSKWTPYTAVTSLPDATFGQTPLHERHVDVQYHAAMIGSAHHLVSSKMTAHQFQDVKMWPRLFARGPFNSWGHDAGINSDLSRNNSGIWSIDLMAKFPMKLQLTPYDKFSDFVYGDVENDGVLDHLPPNTLLSVFLRLPKPIWPHLSYSLKVDEATMRYWAVPQGSVAVSLFTFSFYLLVPIIGGCLAVFIFHRQFYRIVSNKYGFGLVDVPLALRYFPALQKYRKKPKEEGFMAEKEQLLGEGMVSSPGTGWPHDLSKRRKILISTLEYEILGMEPPVKIKLGGMGVMSSMMAKVMEDTDLVWVIPKYSGVEYCAAEMVKPYTVTLFAQEYEVDVERYVYKNITYFLLDSPVFRAQTKTEPYPARMDDAKSAIFYSVLNQCIAQTLRRDAEIDIYMCNDYHGALAPLYLLPKITPMSLSLHNAEFQGLWPLRSLTEVNEVSQAFNLPVTVLQKYVQLGNTFNLLHAAACYISIHQGSVGVAGVSDSYGERSWSRYPALWCLKQIESLPNPDPSDIAALDASPIDTRTIKANAELEAARPEDKRKSQEWAGLDIDPNASLFVFVGRWSLQKGVDLIADVFPDIFDKNPSVQLVCIGPVIDLYGRLAAVKLNRLMELYPGRVYSKPEFTAIPPYLFSGCDFALMPSRDEPFGLVALEFGRKGGLGVGSKLGGLGLMPGYWFPCESTQPDHLLSQFRKTLKIALKSTEEERAILRARSAVLRFPTLTWRHKLEKLQRRAILASEKTKAAKKNRPSFYFGESPKSNLSLRNSYGASRTPHTTPPLSPNLSSPYIGAGSTFPPIEENSLIEFDDPLEHIGSEDIEGLRSRQQRSPYNSPPLSRSSSSHDLLCRSSCSQTLSSPTTPRVRSFADSRASLPSSPSAACFRTFHESTSTVPLVDVPEEAHNEPFELRRSASATAISQLMAYKAISSPIKTGVESFEDTDGGVSKEFGRKLGSLSARNSTSSLSIDKYIMKSERDFFHKKRTSYGANTSTTSMSSLDIVNELPSYSAALEAPRVMLPTKMQRFAGSERLGWPFYAIILAIGQILSATTLQLTLLSGTSSQSDDDLYTIGGCFIFATFFFYISARHVRLYILLTLTFVLFALAFFLVGVPVLTTAISTNYNFRHPISLTAMCLYAAASASFFLLYGQNFGLEAGQPARVPVFRAWIIQGLQTLWTCALWYAGFKLAYRPEGAYFAPKFLFGITSALSALMLAAAYILWTGLPEFYHQMPGRIPSFHTTLFRRKLVLWFLVFDMIRNYWLSPAYGRNWGFLFTSDLISATATLALVIIFFVLIWTGIMFQLWLMSNSHSWLVPLFAIGLGIPRWLQMSWSLSGIALYLPWAGSVGGHVSVSLWLWLGVCDAIQGVGIGMMLLQTLSRQHVCAALAFAQVFGGVTVLIAKRTSPDRLGPGLVFPNFGFLTTDNAQAMLSNGVFWSCLVTSAIGTAGFFFVYRKEQLSKP